MEAAWSWFWFVFQQTFRTGISESDTKTFFWSFCVIHMLLIIENKIKRGHEVFVSEQERPEKEIQNTDPWLVHSTVLFLSMTVELDLAYHCTKASHNPPHWLRS